MQELQKNFLILAVILCLPFNLNSAVEDEKNDLCNSLYLIEQKECAPSEIEKLLSNESVKRDLNE